MPFPPHLLYDDETVALDLRPHWWYFSRHIAAGVPLAILVVLTAAIPSWARSILKYPVAALVLVWAVWLALKYLQWICTYFVVTDQRVLSRSGVLARRGVEIPLDHITNIDFHQSLWERMIGTGDLDLESAGHESDTHFSNVRHPDEVQNDIYREIDLDTRRESGADAAAIGDAVARAVHEQPGQAGGGVADKIEQLARLRDEGHITPDEFERRKNHLLDQL
jgi:uncharacterized membrane protein YdbT with pleckstrin-like domain